jgi:hypothetical protein
MINDARLSVSRETSGRGGVQSGGARLPNVQIRSAEHLAFYVDVMGYTVALAEA